MTTNDSQQVDLEMDLEQQTEVRSVEKANLGTIPKVDLKKDLVSGKGGQLRLEAIPAEEKISNE